MRLFFILCLLASSVLAAEKFDPYAKIEGNGIFRPIASGKINSEWLKPPSEPYRLGAGDKLEIEMVDFPETRQMCVVLPDGTCFFHTLRGVQVSGMSILEFKAALEKSLAVDYRVPQVSLILREAGNRRVWVMGQCKQPGVYTMEGPCTLVEALSRAGGFPVARSLGDTEETVDLQHAFIIRDGTYLPVNFMKMIRNGDMSQNIFLRNKDYIYLPAASGARAYVMGAVNTPLVVDFRENLTLSAALANAGGFRKGAHAQKILIIRDSLAEPKVAVVNFMDITKGKAVDVLLKPKDIVWVPNSPFERLETYVSQILSDVVRTVAINEGGRSVIEKPQPVQVSLGH